MSKLGAAKVVTKVGTVWCHLSELGNVLKLRRFSEGTAFEVNAESDDIEDFVSLNKCKTLVAAKDYSYKEVQVWTKILQKLDANGPPLEKGSQNRVADTGTIVPITELRRIYDTMKLFDSATSRNLAEFFCRTPESLERLWKLSHKSFADYRNLDDWGRGQTKKLPEAPKNLSDVSGTDEFTAYLLANNQHDDDKMPFVFVERELNPWRTKLGMFSNKLPATKSGRGGIDLLLRSRRTGFPVVGEVKVKKDKNAFYALIQAMTYAVELSKPNQLTRLKTHFVKDFGELLLEKARVEIAVVMVNPVDDPTRGPILDLIRNLNRRGKCHGLGRITFLENAREKWTVHD